MNHRSTFLGTMSYVPGRPRRLLAACHPCHRQKIKCSGEQPCAACISNGRPAACQYPRKERKIPVSESYLRELEADNKRLREGTAAGIAASLQTPDSDRITPVPNRGGSSEDDLRLSREETNMLNPMFDNRARDSPEQSFFSSHESAFVGEASCAAFCNRLLRCFDDTYTPCNAGFSNYHALNGRMQPILDHRDSFPERMHAKLLLNVARRFIGNYHPLFLEVTFMQEMDAVYRRELTPSSLWLCKFYVLMALGEIYTNRRGAEGSGTVPGTRYYERAVYMFQDHDLHEEPCLMHVEILTLLGWASNIFGRVRTAYYYSGTAVRLAMSMGMHRAVSSTSTLTPVERESRRRTWWVLYFFDRFSASKLGQPVAVRDEDIDVEMPSMEGLTEEEKKEFLDPQPLITNTRLGRIIGNILTDIYGASKSRRGLCIRGVHGILKQLRSWHDELPNDLRLKEHGTPRPVASLHLAYNQCIIQTTRPVLLHLFKTQFQLDRAESQRIQEGQEAEQQQATRSGLPQSFSPVTLALAESCVNAAKSTSRVVEGLFLDGAVASYGYWDAHHIFSAALILVISAVMNPTTATSEALETLLSILRSMKTDGNIPAVDFCEKLSQVQKRVSNLRSKTQGTDHADLGQDLQSNLGFEPRLQQNQHALSGTAERRLSGGDSAAPSFLGTPSGAAVAVSANTARGGSSNDSDNDASMNWTSVDILGNPRIGSFLDETRIPWLDGIFLDDGTLKQFAPDMETNYSY
ncbi:hypothetical protein NLU13_6418 [Sarocladium strictum]|uniref:Zn(2)-C6 fungal-type domain-containing protein n=1 Tax=Sarocladium strictum TaxID=5046 RepID=A0AA39L735_SARSR|nr:hypothetical protein NLU13_6418 [Sarocladium strictum]